MKKSVAKAWVKALRSGRFKQTTGMLRNSKRSSDYDNSRECGHCCLGVLCAISPFKNNYTRLAEADNSYPHERIYSDWAQMKARNPSVKLPDGSEITLASLNDDRRFSFEQIADIIEQNADRL